MYYVTKTNSKGQPLYQVVEKCKDPLTDKLENSNCQLY